MQMEWMWPRRSYCPARDTDLDNFARRKTNVAAFGKQLLRLLHAAEDL